MIATPLSSYSILDAQLRPFALGILDDSDNILAGFQMWAAQWPTLFKLYTYSSETELADQLQKRHHDIILVDVNLGPGKEWTGTEVFIDLLQYARESIVILYSAQDTAQSAFRAFKKPGAPFRFIDKKPTASSVQTLLLEEVPRLRRRWIDHGRLLLPAKIDEARLDQRLVIDKTRPMSLSQLYVDVMLRGDHTDPIVAIRHASEDDNLMVRYYRAFHTDPTAAQKPWNQTQSSGSEYSLTSAVAHKLMTRAYAGSMEKLRELVLSDLSRYSLRDATYQRIGSYLYQNAEKCPYLEDHGERWIWEDGWPGFKEETCLNLIALIRSLTQSPSVSLIGPILTDLDGFDQWDDHRWRKFANEWGVCKKYFCEPDDFRNGLQALIAQCREGQSVCIDLWCGGPLFDGPAVSRLLTLRITISGMRLDNPGLLHKGDSDLTSGKGFGRVWHALRGYGRCYVHSDTWSNWWNPFAGADWLQAYTEDLSSLSSTEGATHFVFEFVVPFTPIVF